MRNLMLSWMEGPALDRTSSKRRALYSTNSSRVVTGASVLRITLGAALTVHRKFQKRCS